MGNYLNLAESFCPHYGDSCSNETSKSGLPSFSPDQIPEWIERYLGEDRRFNCYPGFPSSKCHDLAVFVSLQTDALGGGHDGHLTLEELFKKVVQHAQGYCAKVTKDLVIIMDTWDEDLGREWVWNLRKILGASVHVEIYLLAFGDATEIRVE